MVISYFPNLVMKGKRRKPEWGLFCVGMNDVLGNKVCLMGSVTAQTWARSLEIHILPYSESKDFCDPNNVPESKSLGSVFLFNS